MKLLWSFDGTDGNEPLAGLTLDGAGNLYGTAEAGGPPSIACPAGCGVVFEIKPSAAVTTRRQHFFKLRPGQPAHAEPKCNFGLAFLWPLRYQRSFSPPRLGIQEELCAALHGRPQIGQLRLPIAEPIPRLFRRTEKELHILRTVRNASCVIVAQEMRRCRVGRLIDPSPGAAPRYPRRTSRCLHRRI